MLLSPYTIVGKDGIEYDLKINRDGEGKVQLVIVPEGIEDKVINTLIEMLYDTNEDNVRLAELALENIAGRNNGWFPYLITDVHGNEYEIRVCWDGRRQEEFRVQAVRFSGSAPPNLIDRLLTLAMESPNPIIKKIAELALKELAIR